MSRERERQLVVEVLKLQAYINQHLSRNMAVGDALGIPGTKRLERIIQLAEGIYEDYPDEAG